ncbi:hypothetical protein D3C76_1779590 [compost metagenome]
MKMMTAIVPLHPSVRGQGIFAFVEGTPGKQSLMAEQQVQWTGYLLQELAGLTLGQLQRLR